MTLCAWHIYLHYGFSKWFAKFHKNKSVVTKILWWFFILTLLSGIIALAHWIITPVHSTIGGVHGKIGFIMVAFAIGHIIKRIKFYNRR